MERKKYTFRYDQEIEELLTRAQEVHPGINTMNALLEKLIRKAVKDYPAQLRERDYYIQELDNALREEQKKGEVLKNTLESIVADIMERDKLDQQIDSKCREIDVKR